MPRRNRVDPWGDIHAVPARGLYTGNRGCLVDDTGQLLRHHNGSLWIICRTQFRDWKHPLAAPRTWTPLFFLDDAVALAAGHRPCGLCRRADYLAFRDAVTIATDADRPYSRWNSIDAWPQNDSDADVASFEPETESFRLAISTRYPPEQS